jgi:hypothetical protein
MPILEEMGVRFTHQKRSLDAFPPEIAQGSVPMLTTPAAAPVALGRTG